MLSSLSTTFELLDRVGPWDNALRTGNPTKCLAVTYFKKGYRQQSFAQGYEEGSAIPWEEKDVLSLLGALDTESCKNLGVAYQHIAARDPVNAFTSMMAHLLLDRDALLVTYLWWGSQRSKEAGALAVDDFTDREGKLALPLPFPLPVGFQVSRPH